MKPWVLIPVRSLAAGKSRLRAALEDGARARINRDLLTRVLTSAAAFPGMDRTAVVSACPATLSYSAVRGVLPLPQAPGCSDLSRALDDAVGMLRARGAESILVLVADLPFVTGEDLREVVALGSRAGEIVVCTDKHRSGTNAIYLPGPATPRFRFGPDSCAAHVRACREIGAVARVHFNARIAFDVDTPSDLEKCWPDAGHAIIAHADLAEFVARIPSGALLDPTKGDVE